MQICAHKADKCVCVCVCASLEKKKKSFLFEMALKCQRFPGKVIKMNDPCKVVLSYSLHRSCKSADSSSFTATNIFV